MEQSPPTALVIGGSLGGLYAALYLQDAGYDVTILERSPRPLSGKGAGIALNPASERFFKTHSKIPLSQLSLTTPTLRYLTTPGTASIPCKYRFASYNTILSSLQAYFPSEKYLLDSNVTSISQDAHSASVTTSAGAVHTASLVVCADGTMSTGRSLLFEKHSNATYAGYIAWRGIVDDELLLPATSEELRASCFIHLTSDGHVLSYPIPVTNATETTRAKVCINWLWYRNTPQGYELDAMMTDKSGKIHDRSISPGQVRPDLVERLKMEAEVVPEPLRGLIRATEHPFIQAVYDVGTSRMVQGRVCMLGDAAFTIRPHTAVGTAKAAEDAWQLAEAVAENGIVLGLKHYERRQMEIGSACIRKSREVGNKLQQGGWEIGRKLALGLFREGDSEVPDDEE